MRNLNKREEELEDIMTQISCNPIRASIHNFLVIYKAWKHTNSQWCHWLLLNHYISLRAQHQKYRFAKQIRKSMMDKDVQEVQD